MGRRWTMMLDEAYAAQARRYAALLIGLHWTIKTLPWVAGAAALGGLGFLAHAGWERLTAADPVQTTTTPVHADPIGAVPVWLWVLAAVLLLILVWLFRPGQYVVTPSARRLRLVPAFGLLIVVFGIAGVSLSAVTGLQ